MYGDVLEMGTSEGDFSHGQEVGPEERQVNESPGYS